MSFTFKENNKFKHIRANILDIPTQDLEKPLTSGLEVFEFIKEHTNKERYAIKGRGRGSRKIHGNCRDLPIEHSEKIAFYVNERDHIREKEERENERSKSSSEISWKLREVARMIEEHNELFDNDITEIKYEESA
tara:strand:+ start:161 stop:565 length:405 start_codon:yes stop_codon:yes gene_type:complete